MLNPTPKQKNSENDAKNERKSARKRRFHHTKLLENLQNGFWTEITS